MLENKDIRWEQRFANFWEGEWCQTLIVKRQLFLSPTTIKIEVSP
jgi:hypothetical protein